MDIKNPPPAWEEKKGKKQPLSRTETDVVFQILHYILTDGKEPTPFHIMLAQEVHSLTRSKELVTALNQHGMCVSYKTVKKIDVDLAERIISTAGDNRLPLPNVLEATSPLNGALDNFDRNESTLAGTGSTHDTILVLFQNVPIDLEKPSEESEISVRALETQTRSTVKLRSKVNCQQLIRMGAIKERGEIPTNYNISETLIANHNTLGPATVVDQSTVSTTATEPFTLATESTTVVSDVRHTSTATNPSPLSTGHTDIAAEPTPNTRSSTRPTAAAEVSDMSTDPSPTTTGSFMPSSQQQISLSPPSQSIWTIFCG